jgi:Rad3-related DNA helicase
MQGKNMIDISKFPYSNIRPQQKAILKKINDNPQYKYYICEIPVGTGKSGIGINICNSFKNGFIITSTKQLQDQYMKDFEKSQDIVSIKGKANYRCALNDNLNCESGYCVVDKKQVYDCKREFLCPYYNKQNEAKRAQIMLTSYQYFLRAVDCSKWVTPRNVLVFDECHLLEDQIVRWAEIKLSPRELTQKYDIIKNCDMQDLVRITIPPDESGIKANKKWLRTLIKLIFNTRNEKFQEMKNTLGITGTDPDSLNEEELDLISASHKEYYELDKLYKKLDVFFKMGKYEDWIIDPWEDGLILTPIEISGIFKQYVDSMAINKIVFMSATILDLPGFRKLFGLEQEDTLLIKAESPFDPQKSPIVYNPICKMNYKEINNNLSKIASAVKEILNNHPNEKGIIHTGNSVISKYLLDNIKSDRLLVRYGEIVNDHIVKAHNQSTKPTVLVSSSLAEGVDLKDDLSRFQIIIKLPWGSLADKRITEKIKKDNNWYNVQMFKTIIQQCGRSTRNKDDYSITYILDNSFKYWFDKFKIKGWFSPQFIKRIIWNKDKFNINIFKKSIE